MVCCCSYVTVEALYEVYLFMLMLVCVDDHVSFIFFIVTGSSYMFGCVSLLVPLGHLVKILFPVLPHYFFSPYGFPVTVRFS